MVVKLTLRGTADHPAQVEFAVELYLISVLLLDFEKLSHQKMEKSFRSGVNSYRYAQINESPTLFLSSVSEIKCRRSRFVEMEMLLISKAPIAFISHSELSLARLSLVSSWFLSSEILCSFRLYIYCICSASVLPFLAPQ